MPPVVFHSFVQVVDPLVKLLQREGARSNRIRVVRFLFVHIIATGGVPVALAGNPALNLVRHERQQVKLDYVHVENDLVVAVCYVSVFPACVTFPVGGVNGFPPFQFQSAG